MQALNYRALNTQAKTDRTERKIGKSIVWLGDFKISLSKIIELVDKKISKSF